MVEQMLAPHYRLLADAEQIERLLNTFLRENEQFDPALRQDHPLCGTVPEEIVKLAAVDGKTMIIKLPVSCAVIVGTIRYLSPFGHHKYGGSFWIGAAANKSSFRRMNRLSDLAEAIMKELTEKYAVPETEEERALSMLEQIESSAAHSAAYLAHREDTKRTLWSYTGSARIRAAEQGLLFGHPFHPTPKSSQGFSQEERLRYAPETGAQFQLHYFAASPEAVLEEWIDGEDSGLFAPDVAEAAESLLGDFRRHYRLLPSHPWEAQRLLDLPEVRRLIGNGTLVDLGPLGDPYFPTSSVRTVWHTSHPFIYKLPLSIRITNFIRTNPLEQLKRAFDASRILSRLAPHIPYERFRVVQERGYRTISDFCAGGMAHSTGPTLSERMGVVFRQNPVYGSASDTTGEADAPIVVAALLEEHPGIPYTPLWQAVTASAAAKGEVVSEPFVKAWLRSYVDISLLPLLWLFLKYGISMEAHAQNAMLSLEQGWPCRFYVRDLEGTSVCRDKAVEFGLFGLPENSPVFYPDGEAWQRWKYYVLVNHFGHLVQTIAYYAKLEETALWTVIREMIWNFELTERCGGPYVSELLRSAFLPAKANLISCFLERSERPVYVNIPNPMAVRDRKDGAAKDEGGMTDEQYH